MVALEPLALTFQLTHPSRGATLWAWIMPLLSMSFQLTHPSRGATMPDEEKLLRVRFISTHTPLAGCDSDRICRFYDKFIISTHTPLAGCDRLENLSWENAFRHFNSHTPRGVRLNMVSRLSLARSISTHTPLAGCDYIRITIKLL